MRDLSMFGKVYVIKSIIIPILHYASAHIDIKGDTVDSVQEIIWDFVWEWKTRFVSANVCYLPKSLGGLGLPNYDLIVKASRVKMVIDIMNDELSWNIIARRHFSFLDHKFDICNFALLVDNSTELIDRSDIPEYYKSCLLAFQELNRKGRIPLENSIIWCNELVKFNNNILAYAHWSKSGMRYLSDIFTNGILHDRDSIKNRLRNKAGFIFEFSRLSRAISSYNGLFDISDMGMEHPTFREMMYKVPLTGELKNVLELSSKDIYLILLNPCATERKSESYWSSKFEGLSLNFSNWYANLFGARIIPHKTAVFNWRIFHGQVHTERSLRKMKLSNGICSLCGQCEEDIFHLFINCEKLVDIWKFVKIILKEFDIFDLQPVHQIVGFIDIVDRMNLPNMILSEARWQIWKYRCTHKKDKKGNKLPLLCIFKYCVKEHVTILMKSRNFEHLRDMLENILEFL